MRLSNRIGFLCVLLLTAAACSSSLATTLPTAVAPSATAIVAPTETPKPIATNPPRPSPTLTPTAVVPVEPTIEQRCPAQPEVSLQELGLKPSSQLFVVPSSDETRTMWNLLGSDQVLRPFTHSIFTGEPAFPPNISPDRRWFTFYARNGSTGDLWISSIDGTQQWIALKNAERPYATQWANDQMVVVLDRQADDLGPTTIFLIDRISNEVIPIAPVYLDWNLYAFGPEAQQVIYLNDAPLSWNLYDYTNDETRKVFPWASGRVTRFYNLAVHWGFNGASVAVMDDTGLDLAFALPPSAFEKNDVPRFHLPVEGDRAWYVDWWSTDSTMVLLTYGFDDTVAETPSLTTNFLYLLDTAKQKLYDLCLPTENLSIDFSSTYSSADERFLAWPTTKENAFGTIVWEIATGRYAWIPDVKVIGWAELNGDVTTP